jgi:hypothetical protein
MENAQSFGAAHFSFEAGAQENLEHSFFNFTPRHPDNALSAFIRDLCRDFKYHGTIPDLRSATPRMTDVKK